RKVSHRSVLYAPEPRRARCCGNRRRLHRDVCDAVEPQMPFEIVEIPREWLEGINVTGGSSEFRSEQRKESDVGSDVEDDVARFHSLAKQPLHVRLISAEPGTVRSRAGDPSKAAKRAGADAHDCITRDEPERQSNDRLQDFAEFHLSDASCRDC